MATFKADPICLVIPPSPFLLDQRVFMSLGVLKVAAALEQQGYTVEVVDLSGIDNYELAIGITPDPRRPKFSESVRRHPKCRRR